MAKKPAKASASRSPNRSLSQSTAGQSWLTQFDQPEKPAAALLLDSIVLVTAEEFERGLSKLIGGLGSAPREGSTAIFATREVLKPEIDWHKPLPPKWKLKPAYFSLSDQRQGPDAVRAGAKVGSEGALANFVRDMCTLLGQRFLDHPSIVQMRRKRCSRIILIDDIVSSGKRSSDFASAICNNPWIRSWKSFGKIELVVLAYGGTESGLALVAKNHWVDDVQVFRPVARGRTDWSASQRAEIEHVCRHKATRTSRPKWPLGFADMFTLMVFHHKCPNNAPAILWAGSPLWKPMFKPRPALGEPTWGSLVTPEERRTAKTKRLVHGRAAATNVLDHQFSAGARTRLLVLALCRQRRRRLSRIADIAELSLPEASAILEELRALGWIDTESRPTDQGIDELEHARSLRLAPSSRPPLKGKPYYPQQLRDPSGPN